MNLEQVNYRLAEVLNQFEENNNEHYRLNEAVMYENKNLKSGNEGAEPVPPEGILNSINILVNKIENQVNSQRYNIRRTSELIYQPQEVAYQVSEGAKSSY